MLEISTARIWLLGVIEANTPNKYICLQQGGAPNHFRVLPASLLILYFPTDGLDDPEPTSGHSGLQSSLLWDTLAYFYGSTWKALNTMPGNVEELKARMRHKR